MLGSLAAFLWRRPGGMGGLRAMDRNGVRLRRAFERVRHRHGGTNRCQMHRRGRRTDYRWTLDMRLRPHRWARSWAWAWG
jgi:hypothetical protein